MGTILHKTDLIQDQLEIGLYSIKRYAFYLQKMVDIRRPALLDLKKATDYEAKEKASKTSKDAMTGHVHNYNITQNLISQLVDCELSYVNTVDKEIVHEIINWHKQAEKRLEILSKKTASVFSRQKELLVRITKARNDCHKQWATLQGAFKDSEKCEQQKLTKKNGAKEYENAYKKYIKEVQKTYILFNTFQNEIRDANCQQERYWNEELPSCVKEFEQIEVERLRVWGVAMETFRNAQHLFFTQSVDTIQMLDDSTQSLDGNEEIQQWSQSLVRIHGFPQEPDILLDHLPCEYTRVQQGDDLEHLLVLDLSVALAQRQLQEKGPGSTISPTSTSSSSAAGGAISSSSVAAAALTNTKSNKNFVKPTYAHAVAMALFNFRQTSPDDLNLREGDLIAILDMPAGITPDEPMWWVAAKFDPTTGALGQKGLVPSNYITTNF